VVQALCWQPEEMHVLPHCNYSFGAVIDDFITRERLTLELFNFGYKMNRIKTLLVISSSKLAAVTNIIHKLLWVLRTIPNDN